MNLWFIFSGIIIFAYLLVQAREDKKTKTVYTSLNNGMMIVIGILYLIRCLCIDVPIMWESYIGCVLFLLLHKIILRRVIGIGDAKALIVFFLQSGLLFSDGTFDLLFPLFIYFIANILFTFVTIAKGIKQKKKIKDIFFSKERNAFFPYLLPSYVVSFLMWVVVY